MSRLLRLLEKAKNSTTEIKENSSEIPRMPASTEVEIAKSSEEYEEWEREFPLTLFLPGDDWPAVPQGKWRDAEGGLIATFETETELRWCLEIKAATMRYKINKLVERLEKGWNFIEEHPDRQDARERWHSLLGEYESLSDQLSLLDQALEAYCNQRKGEPEQITRQLQKVLSQKEAELAQHKSDLSSPYYVEDDWTKSLIACLKSQITEVKRRLIEGGSPSLPRCCKDSSYICLVATRGFDSCIMSPDNCGFSLNVV